MRKIKGSVLLATVEAFLATAAYESYSEAGRALGLSSTTVMRQVRWLELWLRRALIWENELYPTVDGADFIPVAAEIVSLMHHGEKLKSELKKTRVHPDGTITIGGEPFVTDETAEIGRLMVRSRADLGSAKPSPPAVCGNDPLIVAFLAGKEV